MPDANARIDGRMPKWSPDDSEFYQALVGAMENPGAAGSSQDILLAAGPGFKVEVSGVGWTKDFQLDDGTAVLKSAMDADDLRRKVADLPLDAVAPDVPGYALHAIEVFERLGVRDAYYMPAPVGADSMALQDDFRRFEIEQMNAAGGQDSQTVNDRRVAAGTYDRFSEIGSAWSAGRYGDVWRHMTFEASEPARAAAYQRPFPEPNPTLARLDQMIASPIGAGVSGIADLMGASQQTQDRLLGTFGALEQLACAGTGVYKQTLTARAPMPGTLAATLRGVNPAATGARYAFDAGVGRYREVDSGQFVAARNLPWPANAGFESSVRQTVGVGTVVDRYGSLSGRFLGDPSATVSQRGMAPGSQDMPYTQLRVVKPFDAQVGPAAGVPDFGATGGAKQYLPGRTIQQLIDQGFLEVIR